jgi:TRAP-type C4-dicarboxylate transport system permease small subunit
MWNLRSQVKPTARQQLLAIVAAFFFALLILGLDTQAQSNTQTSAATPAPAATPALATSHQAP